MNEELMTREPITISITFGGGEVWNILREGPDFTSDILTNPIARAAFDSMLHENMERVIERARQNAWHLPVVLTGGSVPAHVPGAYPNLSCCGGDTQVVPVRGWERTADRHTDPLTGKDNPESWRQDPLTGEWH